MNCVRVMRGVKKLRLKGRWQGRPEKKETKPEPKSRDQMERLFSVNHIDWEKPCCKK
nr:hypothetical protein K-LCC10_0459 [Kaumoebavirus]